MIGHNLLCFIPYLLNVVRLQSAIEYSLDNNDANYVCIGLVDCFSCFRDSHDIIAKSPTRSAVIRHYAFVSY